MLFEFDFLLFVKSNYSKNKITKYDLENIIIIKKHNIKGGKENHHYMHCFPSKREKEKKEVL
jgi:hypothetical protein